MALTSVVLAEDLAVFAGALPEQIGLGPPLAQREEEGEEERAEEQPVGDLDAHRQERAAQVITDLACCASRTSATTDMNQNFFLILT